MMEVVHQPVNMLGGDVLKTVTPRLKLPKPQPRRKRVMTDPTPAAMRLAEHGLKSMGLDDPLEDQIVHLARALDDAGVREAVEKLERAICQLKTVEHVFWIEHLCTEALSALTGENQQEGSDE